MAFTKQDALDYHRMGRPGKIQVTPTKPLTTQLHLSLAYSPGVAEAVLEIDRDPLQAFELTARANLVAVVSNGTAILGLGDLGPLASKPVMEGKGVLFKRFADIDVFDIEIDATTPDEIVAAVKAIAPTFGGINLEDIKAPDAFEVEERLKEELDIPVFHDDQHGTAIISGAALLNACRITDKKLEDLKIVVNGAGASAIATAKFYLSLGVQPQNLLMVDSKGVIYEGREDGMNRYKQQFAVQTDARTLADAMVGADMVLGLSVAGSITQEMVDTMADEPFIFVLANPTPEIMPELALEVRPKAIIGTGRSDYPNQINNVLGFPFLFRGALDVYATSINEEMKMAAAQALADLAHEDVPDSVLSAYGLAQLKFGRDYLIPKPFDSRVLLWVAPAVAKAAMESGVARREIDLDEYRRDLIARQGQGQLLRNSLISKAKVYRGDGRKRRIVYGEGEHPKILRAAHQVLSEGIAEPILLGEKSTIDAKIAELGLSFEPEVIEPRTMQRPDFVDVYLKMRERKGISRARAESLINGRTHYGLMMVKTGEADGFVSGLTHEYPDILRPALQVFGTRGASACVAGVYVMIVRGRVFLFTDTTVNIAPDAETLAQIAILANDFARTLDIEPKVAMLSFSNFGSTPHPFSHKVRDAVDIVLDRRPEIEIDGEMQADTAVVADIIEERYPFSRVKDANVLVFPDLGAANIAYKLLARLTDAEAIGPILLGVGAPVHVLQAGDEVEDIVTMTAVAVMDAHKRAAQS
ncbi:MAG: NADP-dependent malic enzyme [Anaerolineaceae bacterium]|nr:MAG: NADP-dependent malic enzyme [Anaerolineaceae bacterium]